MLTTVSLTLLVIGIASIVIIVSLVILVVGIGVCLLVLGLAVAIITIVVMGTAAATAVWLLGISRHDCVPNSLTAGFEVSTMFAKRVQGVWDVRTDSLF